MEKEHLLDLFGKNNNKNVDKVDHNTSEEEKSFYSGVSHEFLDFARLAHPRTIIFGHQIFEEKLL